MKMLNSFFSVLCFGAISLTAVDVQAASYINATSSGYAFGDSAPANTFSELLPFSVSSTSEIYATVSGSGSISFDFTKFDLVAANGVTTLVFGTTYAAGLKGEGAYFDSIGAGNYFLKIVGTKSGTASYSGNLTISAVPEPESLALMMAGLGLIGGIASRKAKKLA